MEKYMEKLWELEQRFQCCRDRLQELIGEQRNRTVSTTITKGYGANHTPFYCERIGMKLQGKTLKAVPASGECRRNSYDADGRLIMTEEYMDAWNCFRVSEIYLYGERTERLFLQSECLVRLDEFDNPFCNTNEVLSFAGSNGYIVEEFRYEDERLTEIQVKRPTMKYREVFRYENGTLAQIVRVHENGYKELLFSTKKPDFGKIRQVLTDRISVLAGEQDFASIGLEGFLYQAQPMICVCFSGQEQPSELIADWGTPMVDIPVYDYQFSDAQLRKCVKLVAEILVQLVQDGGLAGKEFGSTRGRFP